LLISRNFWLADGDNDNRRPKTARGDASNADSSSRVALIGNHSSYLKSFSNGLVLG
jgi:hypothetical protein